MSRLNDIALATQVAVFGNKRAFDQLVRQYQSPVRRFFLSQTLGNEALSDDLAQDTFLKAYTHMAQYRGASSLLTWLTRIAYNVWYDYSRRVHYHISIDDEKSVAGRGVTSPNQSLAFTPSSAEFSDTTALKTDIYQALGQLREEERSCITLQLIDGYAIDEIATITGMPQGTVKSHLKRGKDKMANYLRKNGYDR